MTILPESFRGLRTRLVLWFVALSLVPLAIVGVLAFRRSSADLSIKAGEFLQTQAEATIDKIDRNLFERYGDVQAFTFHPKARGGRADVEEIANVYTKAYGIYDLMLVVDADGLVKGCNSRDRDGAPIDSSRFVGRSVRDEDWYRAIQSGRIAAGQSWFADPTVDPWVGELGLTGLTLNFAAPIFDEQGHFAGAWSNRASFDRIVGEIMQETRASLHKQGFGTIASQVLTRDGLVLDDADPAAVLKTNLARSGSDAARRGTQGENGFSAQADVRTGRELVSGFASSKGALGFPGYGWTVLVSQDLDDALASVHRLRTFLGWLVLGAAVVIVAAASRVARDIARPISRTAEVLDALAAGNLEQQLETASRDEIGRMGAALNRTTQVLRSLMEETSRLTQAARDGRLAERTDALRFEGGYRELCEGVNGMLDAVLEPVRESTLVMQRLAAGDLSQAVRGDYAGDHRVLTDSLNATIEVLRGVLEELNRLVAAADAGSLSERADAERFAGAYAELCARVNRMLDGILAPIGEAREVLAAVAQGDLTRAVRGEYRGDHERVKTSLNETLAVLRRLMEDTSSLIRACERGELSARAPAERYQGSYRELCTQINTMLDAVVEPIHESTRVLERVAEGDLSARIVGDYAGQHAAIKVAVNAAVEGMRGALVSISTSAGELSRSSTDLDGVSTRIGDDARRAATQIQAAAGSAGEVDSNVQSVASATEEMTASIDEIALRSSEASRSASSAVETVREAHACVTRLGASSAEIESVVKLITAIAEQTNLLALNATIEAARAGESGRGFAVVANEVKELANQTSTATAEIATKIAGIQGDTRAAVEAMARIQEVIAAIHALQTSIAGAVEEQSATTKEITRSVSDVARGTSSIVQSLDGVAQIADQTSRGAQQAGAGAQSASRMAQELHALVAQFRCDAPVADGAQSPKSTRAPQTARAPRPLAATVAR